MTQTSYSAHSRRGALPAIHGPRALSTPVYMMFFKARIS